MQEFDPETQPKPIPRKKRKQKRSAWILTGGLVVMMVLRMAAGLARPLQASSHPTTVPATATAVTDAARAEAALTTFFNLLVEHRYEEATTYYGGSYDALISVNPQDSTNHGTLLQDACTQDGYQCLPVKRVKSVQQQTDESFVVTVTFAQEDSSLLTQPTGTNGTFRTEFPFTITRVNGRYLVQDLPVHLP